jgi:hypothetical protein
MCNQEKIIKIMLMFSLTYREIKFMQIQKFYQDNPAIGARQGGQGRYRALLMIAVIVILMGLDSKAQVPGRKEKLHSAPTTSKNLPSSPNKAANSKFNIPNLLVGHQAVVPVAKSVWWHYNRALIYHLQEKDGQATIELYRGLEVDPRHSASIYFLCTLYKDREKWGDIVATLSPLVADIPQFPVQLLLVRAYGETEQYFAALELWEKLAQQLKLGNGFIAQLDDIRQIVKPPKRRTLGQVS